ncbi:MAG: Cyclic di-GMP phosphodiesterase response regulator RpfG [bacterium ADurb.Bin363]|nr:MAG: Cyclic di-GMP phosphodiesterase response regulator RpfG [bacterium ADurb.Bin363]
MFKSFRIKLFIVFLITTLFVSGVSIYFVYLIALNSQLIGLKKTVVGIASTTVLMIEPEEFRQIDPDNPVLSESFIKINNLLHDVLINNPDIRFAYTLIGTKDPNICKFVADANYFGRTVMSEEDIKDINYYVHNIPELREKIAFSQPVATKSLYKDKWGVQISGYAPIKDKVGNTLGVVCIDLSAEKIASFQKYVTIWTVVIFILDLIISLILSIIISSKVSLPILKIIEHTKVISEGNFKSKIEIQTKDEIKELADAVNQMIDKLDYMFLDLTKTQSELKLTNLDAINRLALASEYKDDATYQHLNRVTAFSRVIAEAYGLPEEDVSIIELVSPLHDLGKIGIPDNILLKPGRLTDEEYEVIKDHPIIGYNILKESLSPYLKKAAIICLTHHEYFDGTGYPYGTKGEDIHIYGRIVALADVFDALTSKRPYKEPMSLEETVEIIKKKRGIQFDPKVVDAFLSCLDEIKKYKKFYEDNPVKVKREMENEMVDRVVEE